MDHSNHIKWTLLATLGWTAACGGSVVQTDESASGGSNTIDSGSGGGVTATGGSGDTTGASGGTTSASGGATSASGGATSASGGGHGAGTADCTVPKPVIIDGKETGFIRCEEGYQQRAEVVTCPNLIDKDSGPQLPEENGEPGDCILNSDCAGELSYCAMGADYWPIAMAHCVTGCVSDSDCGSGFICECGDPVGRCLEASCTSNEDCQSGQLCASDDYPSCGETPNFGCTTEADLCRSQNDCQDEGCKLDETGRSCHPLAVCGRPFLVQGDHRQAELCASDAFRAQVAPLQISELSESEKAVACTHYLQAAQMEHASIAAFARFTLQLLQLGAPAELIRQAGEAQLDETHHAEICFALAHQYGSGSVGPGPLDLSGAFSNQSLEEVVALCVIEGCMGESIAALEAQEAAAACADPQLRDLLTRIAEDELRHSALSYRFVSWAIQREPSLRSFVTGLLHRIQKLVPARSSPLQRETATEERLASHGVLSHSRRTRIRAEAIEQIVEPCMKAMLSRHSSVDQVALTV